MNPFGPRPAIVQQIANDYQQGKALFELWRQKSHVEKQASAETLKTFADFGDWCLDYRRDLKSRGETLKSHLEKAGIDRRRAYEAMNVAMLRVTKPDVFHSLGSQTAAIRWLAENSQAEDDDALADECGVEPEEDVCGTAHGKTGGGPATGGSPGKRTGKAGSPPSSQQQTITFDPAEAQEKLEKSFKAFCREFAAAVEEWHQQLQQKLRLETEAGKELRRLGRVRGQAFEFILRAAPEVAAGFEDKAEPGREEWRVLNILGNVLSQVGGRTNADHDEDD